MKIFASNGDFIVELPDQPKNFNGGHKAGHVDIFVAGEFVGLGKYEPDRATEIVTELRVAYVNGKPEFTMPEED